MNKKKAQMLEAMLLECKNLVDKVEVAVYKTDFLPEDEHVIIEELRQLTELYGQDKSIIIQDGFFEYEIETRLDTIKELVPPYISKKITDILDDMVRYREFYEQVPQIVSGIEKDSMNADSGIDF